LIASTLPDLTKNCLKERKAMTEPVVFQKKPMPVEVEAGITYLWCACGRSQKQPFCDGSHSCTDILPVAYVAEESGIVLFCGCKQTLTEPLCDGTHAGL
jgi:CDGSH-type Zn-finger protein